MPGPAFADGQPPLEPYAPPAHEGADAHPSPSSTPNGAEDNPAFALRLQHRSLGRLSLELNLGIDVFKHQSNAGDPFPVTRILLGHRKNVTPVLGYHLRGGPMLGIPRRSTSEDPGPGGVQTDTTLLTGASAEGVFVVGPFGHFFVGPILCFDYVHFSNTVLNKVYPTVYLHNGFTAGGGFDIGGVFGARDQLIVYQSVRMTAGTGDSMIFLLFGIGWLWQPFPLLPHHGSRAPAVDSESGRGSCYSRGESRRNNSSAMGTVRDVAHGQAKPTARDHGECARGLPIDRNAAAHGLIRVVDESGDSWLIPTARR